MARGGGLSSRRAYSAPRPRVRLASARCSHGQLSTPPPASPAAVAVAVEVVGASDAAFADAFATSPTICNYSLEGRLAPRVDKMAAAGLRVDIASVTYAAKMTDARFARFLAAAAVAKAAKEAEEAEEAEEEGAAVAANE